jgi:hypothetical protein
MPTLHRFRKAAIRMYAGDHGEPHFHVETPEARCSVAIATLRVLAGAVPRRVLREACAWAESNRPLLVKAWKELHR